MTNTRKAVIVSISVVVLGVGIYFATKTNKNGKILLGGKKKYIDEGDVNLVPVFSAKQKATTLYIFTELLKFSNDSSFVFKSESNAARNLKNSVPFLVSLKSKMSNNIEVDTSPDFLLVAPSSVFIDSLNS